MKDKKLKIGVIGLGQRGAAYGMTDGSIGLLGNILNNSEKINKKHYAAIQFSHLNK